MENYVQPTLKKKKQDKSTLDGVNLMVQVDLKVMHFITGQ